MPPKTNKTSKKTVSPPKPVSSGNRKIKVNNDNIDAEIISNVEYFLDELNGYGIHTSEVFSVSTGKGFYATLPEINKEWKKWEVENSSPKDARNVAEQTIKARVVKYFQGPVQFQRENDILDHYYLADDMTKGCRSYREMNELRDAYIMDKVDNSGLSPEWWV